MKRLLLLLVVVVNHTFTIVLAQTDAEKTLTEKEVRKLDSLHAAAVLSGDFKGNG